MEREAEVSHSASRATAAAPSSPPLEDFHPSFLVAAEGAHSLCRSTPGIDFEGHAREDSYLLVDVSIDGDGLTETDFHVFSSVHGFMGLFPLGHRLFRIIAADPLTTAQLALASMRRPH